MSDHRERLGSARRSLVATGAIIITVACLAVAGCSSVSVVNGNTSGSASGTAHPGVGVLGAPGFSGFGASYAKAVPPSLTGPPADPFAGTPADHWADGAAGIALPKAKPVGGFTAAQVESAYQTTRKLLIAANLNEQTLLGGAPTAFAGLLTNAERTWFTKGLTNTGVDKNGYSLNTRLYIVSFPAGSAQLIGSVIKVHGSMYARATTNNGNPELDIHLDYLFVYPIEPPHQPTDWMRIVAEDSWIVEFANWRGAATSFEPWVDFNAGHSSGVAGVECGSKDGYQHPDYPNTAARVNPSETPTGKPINPYVAGQSRTGTCAASTGT